jgi:hypothetical protein
MLCVSVHYRVCLMHESAAQLMVSGGRGEDEGGEANTRRSATREGGRWGVLHEIGALPGSERLQSSRRPGGQ